MTPKAKKLINGLLDKEIDSYRNWWEDKNKNDFIEAKEQFNKLKEDV